MLLLLLLQQGLCLQGTLEPQGMQLRVEARFIGVVCRGGEQQVPCHILLHHVWLLAVACFVCCGVNVSSRQAGSAAVAVASFEKSERAHLLLLCKDTLVYPMCLATPIVSEKRVSLRPTHPQPHQKHKRK